MNSPCQAPLDSPERRRLPILLRHAWYGLNQAFRRRIAHLKLTPDQFTVLRTLIEGAADGLSQRGLSQRICSDPNTIASLVERMEGAGLLERRPDARDRRVHRIRVRPLGRRKYHEARAIALDLQARILEAVPAADQARFLENLEAVAEACRSAAPRQTRGAVAA